MRGMYDNSYNRNRTRIDTRNQSDPAVQAGMRKIHRGMDGRVIGGVTAEGQGIGTRSTRSNPFADMPDRPSLDSISAAVSGGAPAAPVGAPTPAPATSAPAVRPPALGGGLSRWERLNPNAKKAFSAGSPANDKATNRRLAQRMKQKAAPTPAQSFVQAAMPKPSVPSMVPVSDTVASKARAVGGWKKPPMLARR